MRRVLSAVLVLTALAPTLGQAAKGWSTCVEQVRSIQNGTLPHLNGLVSGTNITRANIDQYIWHGPIDLLKSTANRTSMLAVNYLGCREICGEGIRWLEAESALAIVTTWIFPLSILFSLPFESDKRKTMTSLVNWIGSPTVTMTETLFNIWQTVQSYRYQCGRHMPMAWKNDPDMALASSYVLSCLNQFKMPGISPGQPSGTALSTHAIIQDVLYGLYEPLSSGPDDATTKKGKTRHLILLVSHTLRQQRRRGVVPLICTMVIFLAAFIFSIVLAFYADADSTVTPLTLGLLYSWVPAMVMLTIVDRNPHSPERAAEILERWIYNVSYIRHSLPTAAAAQSDPQNALPPAGTGAVQRGPRDWWKPRTGNEPPDEFERAFAVTEFIGQGRTGETAGLTLAILKATRTTDFSSSTYDQRASEVYKHLYGAKRKSITLRWLGISCVSFVVYWTFILMAFTVAYNSPTAGLGCWSGSFLLYALLSSVAWSLRFWRAISNLVLQTLSPQQKSSWRRGSGRVINTTCFLSNTAAALFLLFITIVVLTGMADNCWCGTTWIFSQFRGFPTGGYQAFDNPETRKHDFTVVQHWVPPTITALLVLIAVVALTFYAWKRCQSLWKPLPLGRRIGDPSVDLTFLQ